MGTLVFLLPLKEHEIQTVQSIVPDWKIVHGKVTEHDQSIWSDADIMVHWKPQATEWLKQQSRDNGSFKLRWVHTWSAGVDNIPFDLFKQHHVKLSNSSGIHAYPISETIFAMILGFTRKLPQYVRNQQAKRWHHAHLNDEIHEKTLGIIGTGAIGTETAKIAKAFGMRVLGVRRSGKPHDYFDQMYTMEQLSEMLPLCDYIVVSLPSTEETYHLLGQQAFACMKPDAFFINIGRGSTVDTEALTDALQAGSLAGAGLDVFESEPLAESHPLWDMDNVIITPHTAGSTRYYNERAMRIFIENLLQFLVDESLKRNEVDLDLQY